MKPRTRLYLIAILSIIGIAIFTFSRMYYESLPFFPATINRDCAPWDGPAFTVSIPVEASVIEISIFQSPDILLPTGFSFPDDRLREGHALLLLPADFPEELNGSVWFEHVDPGKPAEGRFKLTSERGAKFEGRFVAEWGIEIVYCG